MKKILKIVGISLVVLVVVVAIWLSIYKQIIRQAEPQYSGTLQLGGLQDSVSVVYDKYAVPHITAANQHDLFYAAGYVCASERMWQMEITRLASQGRLSEVLGKDALETDKLLRTIGFYQLAKEITQSLPDSERAIIQAYADGVNTYIQKNKDNLPAEYRLLNFSPEPWTVENSIGYVRLMAWELNVAWHLDVVLGAIVDRVGETKGQAAFPHYPDSGPFNIPNTEGRFAEGLLPFLHADYQLRQILGIGSAHIGSNNWVVDGNHSVSGKPIIANDPHLGFTQPSKWYEMHLKAPGIDVAGVTLPGMPSVVIGHNEHIAWAFTNVMADDADFFIETIDPGNPYLYRYNGQWVGMDRRTEIIKVRNAKPDTLIVRITKHGPIVSDVHPLGKYKKGHVISMRWTGQEISDEFGALLKINTAKNWHQFSQGVGEFHVPGQNMLYADTEGNIGYRPAVMIPIRNKGNGIVPVPGDVSTYEWSGFVKPLELPYLYNPEEGFIATANNKVINDSRFKYHISNLYEPPARIERIRALLKSKKEHSVQDFAKYQMDYQTPHAQDVTPYFLHAFANAEVNDPYLSEAIQHLRKWDYTMGKNSIAASIFNVAFLRLIYDTYHDELGDTLLYQYADLANAPIRNITWLLGRPYNSWWDDVETNGIETRDTILQLALREAVDWLKSHHGRSMINWQWGNLHQVVFPHLIGEASGLANAFFGFNVGPYKIGGSGTTVNSGAYNYPTALKALTDLNVNEKPVNIQIPEHPFRNILGPSMRQITDLANIDNAQSVIYSGQSGHSFDPHYDDQTPLWLHGKYHPLPISDKGVAAIAVDTLQLIPVTQ